MTSFVRRVDQLDALYLDDELLSLLNAQYRKAFKFLPNSFMARFGSEVEVLFKFLFKYLPLHTFNSTFGQSLFHLHYGQSASGQSAVHHKLKFLAFASVCMPWFYERIVRRSLLLMANKDFSEKILNISYKFEHMFYTIYQTLTLLNFCIFLQNSTYPTIVERILHIRPLYSEQQSIRPVQNDNIDRELLWHGLSEFLGFTLPMINIYKVKGFFKRTCAPRYYKNHYKKYFTQSHKCSICGDIPNFPHTINCSHVFCYYCIASILLADPSYLCSDCDVKADGMDSLKPLALNATCFDGAN